MNRILPIILILSFLLAACCGGGQEATQQVEGLSADAAAVAAERGLTPDDIYAAVRTYMPPGQLDPCIMLASGGQSGQVLVIGVPSVRILKVVGVFTPELWQGFGFGGSSDRVIQSGFVNGKEVKWGDTHHPSFSETAGDYDGEFAFIELPPASPDSASRPAG